MPKHHTEDYKISAVKHYINKTKNLTKTCKEFDCSRISLKRWVGRYLTANEIKRYNRNPVSYKITKDQVNYAIKLLKQNQQITMFELSKLIKKKYTNYRRMGCCKCT
jgi:transposase-like protein